MRIQALLLTVSVFLIFGCTNQASKPVAQGTSPLQTAQSMDAGAPEAGSVAGKIVETMNSGNYTYVKLNTSQGEVWAAVPETQVKVGDSIELVGAMEMKDFQSKTLNRTFPSILFAQLKGAAAATGAGYGTEAVAEQGSLPPGHPPLNSASKIDPATINVPKAGGAEGKSVADVYSERQALKGKPVKVNGVVVKFSGGIMKKNWVHIQDGTGKAETQNHDLTVTTQDMVKVGDRVQVRGTVFIDKDFGAGYKYGTMLEEAKVELLK